MNFSALAKLNVQRITVADVRAICRLPFDNAALWVLSTAVRRGELAENGDGTYRLIEEARPAPRDAALDWSPEKIQRHLDVIGPLIDAEFRDR